MVASERTALPRLRDVQADWRLGVAATGLDLAGNRVLLADGTSVGFDKVLITTGVRARRWPRPDEAALDGVSPCAPPRTAACCATSSPPGPAGCW